MAIKIPSLKRFAALATDLTDRYRFNPFVQATVHIIAIQVILGLILILVCGWAIQYAQTNTVGSIRYHIQQVRGGESLATGTLPQAVQNVHTRTVIYVFITLILLITLFSYLLIRFALSPARNSLQFQKRFIGNLAHEIRTPLAIIKTSTEVTLMDPSLKPDLRTTLEDTIGELNRISETINNLLSFDNLIRPERMKTVPVNLAEISESVANRHQSLAHTRGIQLQVSVHAKAPVIMGNAVGLEEVVTNLVKNALNYTPANQNGRVTISIEREFGERIALTVADTGIGITQKDLIHIFEPFYRGDTSRARGIGTGTSGLGLAIVNEIIRLHHGTTTVRSTLGHGTAIKVSFRQASPEELAQFAVPQTVEPVDEVSIDFS